MLSVIIIAITIFALRMIIRSGKVFDFQNEVCRSLASYEKRERELWSQIQFKVNNNQDLSKDERFIYNTFGGDSDKFEEFLRYQWLKISGKNSHLKLWLSGKPLRFCNFFNEEELSVLAV